MALQLKPPALNTGLFRPGLRVAVACSGGADSVALLRSLLEARSGLGVVLSVAHMDHGIRGAESEADQRFVADLAARFDLSFHTRRVDTPAVARASRQGLEEAARELRYAWFQELLSTGEADAVATAHTLDDQSETVLHRLLRGAWTDGLSGIHPMLKPAHRQFGVSGQSGVIVRPFLTVSRKEIEAWLKAIGQPWQEDSSNLDMAFTRNRIRHRLLPALAEYDPQIQNRLSHLATLARDEEAYWQAELARLLPSLLLPGKPVRGGGRATETLPADRSVAMEIERLRALHPALRRRVLRAATARLGVSIDFEDTERLLEICGLADEGTGNSLRAGLKLQLEKGLRAQRTPRELRLCRGEIESAATASAAAIEYPLPIPGTVAAPAFGLRLQATLGRLPEGPLPDATLRTGRPSDRVVLRHSRSRLKLKEALQRARLPVAPHPVLEWRGEIVWMSGVPIESTSARDAVLTITSLPLA